MIFDRFNLTKYLSTGGLHDKLKDVELLSLDADGTLTDGAMYFSNDGDVMRRFYSHDGLGITMIKRLGVKVIIVTGSESEAIVNRSRVLNVDDIIKGSDDKGEHLADICEKKFNISLDKVVHVGDDINDISAFKKVGIAIAPVDAIPAVFKHVSYVTKLPGGRGCVREICDMIYHAKTGEIPDHW